MCRINTGERRYCTTDPDINQFPLGTFHPPRIGDIVVGNETGIRLEIIPGDSSLNPGYSQVYQEFDRYQFTGWVDEEIYVASYPLVPGIPPLFPEVSRTENALLNVDNYTFPYEILGLGNNIFSRLEGTAFGGIPRLISQDPTTMKSHIQLSDNMPYVTPSFFFTIGDLWPIVTGLQFNDEPMRDVDVNNFEYLLKTRKYNSADTINLRLKDISGGSFEEYESGPLQSKRSPKTNFGHL